MSRGDWLGSTVLSFAPEYCWEGAGGRLGEAGWAIYAPFKYS